ncbi:MAG: hypothetical protein CMJ83_00585 [Planctomycetes bacterium]|jgi:3-methyladenine DNA glycosylase AlkD|nr:hypothetical protein [Planctomycetota bacterium]
MTVAQIVKKALRDLRAAADPERKAHMEGYAASAMKYLGVAVPAIRNVSRQTAKEMKGAPPKDVVALAQAFVDSGFLEARQLGYEILEFRKDALATLRTQDLRRLGKGMDNWASVDAFACSVAGRVWLGGGTTDAEIHRWARSSDLWWRRAALASTVSLNFKSRGGTGDPDRTFAICEMLHDDHEDMIVKALSWALRSVIPHDASRVGAFLVDHEETLHPRVVREVSRKLTTGKKN